MPFSATSLHYAAFNLYCSCCHLQRCSISFFLCCYLPWCSISVLLSTLMQHLCAVIYPDAASLCCYLPWCSILCAVIYPDAASSMLLSTLMQHSLCCYLPWCSILCAVIYPDAACLCCYLPWCSQITVCQIILSRSLGMANRSFSNKFIRVRDWIRCFTEQLCCQQLSVEKAKVLYNFYLKDTVPWFLCI